MDPGNIIRILLLLWIPGINRDVGLIYEYGYDIIIIDPGILWILGIKKPGGGLGPAGFWIGSGP
jgi:hypothetical protein